MKQNKLKLLSWARKFSETPSNTPRVELFKPPVLPDGVVPKDMMAMDDAVVNAYRYANTYYSGTQAFLGYPALAELTQRPEYRMMSEKTAQAMTRKWIKLKSKGDTDKSAQIKIIEDALIKFKLREMFREAATYDGFFGRAQLFIDVGDNTPEELVMPLIMDVAKIRKGSLRKFKLIDPTFTYPYKYSAANPLADDYYKPTTWFVMGTQVHSSRLLLFVSRPVPDLLKPAYNFGGISMSQLGMPYVENWIRTRTSVGRMISNYSTSGVLTNMENVLMDVDDSGDDLIARAELFAAIRDNQGLLLLDKNSEEFFQYNTPLSGLDKLQAQAQEHMASVCSTPLSVLLGITPSGLNASSEGEIRIFYDYVAAQQQILFHDVLKKAIDVIQLSEIGAIDNDITFEFVSLWEMDEGAKAKIRKDDGDSATAYFAMGAVSADEVRQRLANDPDSGWNGLEASGTLDAANVAQKTS